MNEPIEVSLIPLKQAYLCPNCEMIGNCSSRCLGCANPHVINLASILDRRTEEEPKP